MYACVYSLLIYRRKSDIHQRQHKQRDEARTQQDIEEQTATAIHSEIWEDMRKEKDVLDRHRLFIALALVCGLSFCVLVLLYSASQASFRNHGNNMYCTSGGLYEVSFTAAYEYVVSWIVSSDHVISDPEGRISELDVRPLSVSPYRLRCCIYLLSSRIKLGSR